MEKVLYCLRRPEGADADAFRASLVDGVATRLVELGMRGVEVHATDSAVDAASGSRIETGLMTLPDAMLAGWVDSANAPLRSAYDDVVAATDSGWFGWVVSESVPLRGGVTGPGRAPGYSQFAFLRRPPEHPFDDWLAHWHGTHTAVAMETQATTRYVQNLVVRALNDRTPELTALVEEVFPDEAMTDPAVFMDAVGDPERQRANGERLMASVAAFLGFTTIDVAVMSRHLVDGAPPC